MTYKRTDINRTICNNQLSQSFATYQLLFTTLHNLKGIPFELMITGSKQEDLNNGVDCYINNQPVSLRYRNLEYLKYSNTDVTIRYNNNHDKSEFHKFVTNEIKSTVVIFYWTDNKKIKRFIMIPTQEISNYIKENQQNVNKVPNYDGSSFVTIPLKNLKSVLKIDC